jgi:hypothetical protein
MRHTQCQNGSKPCTSRGQKTADSSVDITHRPAHGSNQLHSPSIDAKTRRQWLSESFNEGAPLVMWDNILLLLKNVRYNELL